MQHIFFFICYLLLGKVVETGKQGSVATQLSHCYETVSLAVASVIETHLSFILCTIIDHQLCIHAQYFY